MHTKRKRQLSIHRTLEDGYETDLTNTARRDIINRETDRSGVAEHFCKPGHSANDLQILPLLQIHNEHENVR